MDLWVALALIGAGILCYIIETFNPGFFIAVPGTVLIFVGVLGVFAPDVFDYTWSWFVLIVLAALSAYVTLRVYKRLAPPEQSQTTTSVDNIVGRRGMASAPIDATQGEARIDGETWRARSKESIQPGTRVEVIGREGNLILTVKSIPNE